MSGDIAQEGISNEDEGSDIWVEYINITAKRPRDQEAGTSRKKIGG